MLLEKPHRDVKLVDNEMNRAEFQAFCHKQAPYVDIALVQKFGKLEELPRCIFQDDVDLLDFHGITSNRMRYEYITKYMLFVVWRKGGRYS
jgi:hypothetical protein